MKVKKFTLIASVFILVLTAGILSAQEPAVPGGSSDEMMANRSGLSGSLYRLGTLAGMTILGIEGVEAPQPETPPPAAPGDPAGGGTVAPAPAPQVYGNARDVILMPDGTITHLLIEVADFEGVEGGLYLIPPDGFTLEAQGIRVTVPQEEFTAVEDEDQAAAQAGEGALRVRDLLDYDVVGSDGESIGGVEDMVADLDQGTVVYIALGRGGILGIGKNRYALPFDAITSLNEEEGQVQVQATDADFEGRKGFPGDQWPQEVEGITGQDAEAAGEQQTQE